MVDEMREIVTSTPVGHHADHIVPLSSPLVCGLNVPWNLQHLPDAANLLKSNHYWPGHPYENTDMFEGHVEEPHQMSLAL